MTRTGRSDSCGLIEGNTKIKLCFSVPFLACCQFVCANAYACSCGDIPLSQKFALADYVFVAEVVSTDVDSDKIKGVRVVRAKFMVLEKIKGEPKHLERIVSYGGSGACGMPLSAGDKLLVFTGQQGAINICNGTAQTTSIWFQSLYEQVLALVPSTHSH